MKMIKHFAILLLSMILLGCSHLSNQSLPFKDRDKAYLSAKSIPPLKIPPGISSDAFHAQYPVSDANYPGSAKQVDLTPPGL